MPAPKSSDLSDPNKQRGVNLMDIRAEAFSRILCQRLFHIINEHVRKYQFGSTPNFGCQYGTFTIKTLLQIRHNHNIPTYEEFFDIVKVFDTVNHDLLIDILERYGAPPKPCSSITRMYTDLKVVLKIGKLKHPSIRQWECNKVIARPQ